MIFIVESVPIRPSMDYVSSSSSVFPFMSEMIFFRSRDFCV